MVSSSSYSRYKSSELTPSLYAVALPLDLGLGQCPAPDPREAPPALMIRAELDPYHSSDVKALPPTCSFLPGRLPQDKCSLQPTAPPSSLSSPPLPLPSQPSLTDEKGGAQPLQRPCAVLANPACPHEVYFISQLSAVEHTYPLPCFLDILVCPTPCS